MSMRALRFALLALAALGAAFSAQAQIAFRGAASAGATSGGFAVIAHASQGGADTDTGGCPQSMTPAIPGGTTAGDMLVAVVTSKDDDPLVMNGWNLLYADNPLATYQVAVFWRIATGGDPNTITKTGGGCNVMIGRISRFTGVDPLLPFDGGVGASYQNANSVTTGSMTTTNAASMLVIASHVGDDVGTGAPGGFTEAWDSTTAGGSDAAISLKYQLQTTAGSKGPYNFNKAGPADPNHGVLFALRPARPSLTINVPAGTAAGDYLIATIAVRDESVLITPPTGWSAQPPVVQAAGNGSRQQIFTRVADGTEPASYTWLFESAHSGAVGAIVSYQGVDTAAPIDALNGNVTPQGGDSNLLHRALGVTTTMPDTMVVSTHAFTSAETWTPPAGMTERVDVASQGTPNAAGISLSLNEVEQPFAGASGDKVAAAAGNGDTGTAQLIALRPIVLPPRLHWSMDETAWTGAAGEVQDLSGNGLHGTAVNGAATASATPVVAGSPGTCRYGVLDGANQYVEVADNPLLDLPDELTVMAWIRPETLPGGGGLMTIVSKDENFEFHLTSSGQVNWWWGGGALSLTTSGTVPTNAWTHVAIMYSRSRGVQRIYLNGVADPNTNNQTGALTLNADAFQVGGDQGFAGRFFDGLVDEVYVFAQGLNQGRIQQYMNATRPCVVIDHYSISHAGSGVACDTHQVTITAHDAAHNPVDAGAATLALSTTNSRGTWTGIAAGGGALSDPTAGDGAATYQFAVGSNSVILNFRYANLAGTSETFGFNVSDGTFSETSGTAAGTEDPAFTMSQAGFRFSNVTDGSTTIPVQISGKPSNTGWNAKTIRIQAIRTDTQTGSCVGLFGSQTRSVDLGAECNSPATCAARQVGVNGGAIATSNDNAGAGAAAYTSVSLNFNAASEADTVIAYPDAGQVSLHARYDLDPDVAGFEAIGGSNAFVVRPFGLAFPGASHANTATGALLAAAGDPFAMTVTAFQWSAGEDADADGVPDAGVNITDNGTVPNFAATATAGVSANLPGVAPGAITRGAGCAGAPGIALAGGTASAADWCYSEAGNAVFTASVANYLAAGVNIAGSSAYDGDPNGGYVGRFRPKHFAVTGAPTLTNRSALACASTFTYLNEGLDLDFTLEARNAQNALTQNYTGAYARLSLATAASLGLGARSGATDLTGRVDSSLAPSGAFSNGVAALTVTTGVRRASPDSPDGPFAGTQFGIAPVDPDGVAMGTLDLDVDGAGGNDHFAVGPATELRFGRLRLQNAYGPTNLPLPLRLETQYWSGGGFVLNAQDGCTRLNRSDIALGFSGALAACETAVQEASLAFAGGAATATLAAPGASNQGSVLLAPQLGTAAGTYCPSVGAGAAAATSAGAPYLLGRWNDAADPDGDANTAYDDNPAGQAAFGLYGSQPRNFIFQRENY